MLRPIKFGSDGWRGIIARDFTIDSVACICDSLFNKTRLDNENEVPTILIGYDRRFMADIFAHNFARIWTALGGTAFVSSTCLPSPVLAWYTRAKSAALGVMITASHNPPQYLGVKIKDNFGGSASPEYQREISTLASSSTILERVNRENVAKSLEFDPKYLHNLQFDVNERYPECAMIQFAELNPKLNGRFLPKIIVDFMHGAAADLATRVFNSIGIDFESLRVGIDPTFGGSGPEPVAERLQSLRQRVIDSNGKAIGIAFDGDGDRLTAIDETGAVLLSSELFSIHLRHLVLEKGERGKAVGTVSFSSVVDRVAANLNVELIKVPVGFKTVTEEFRKGGVLIGGEESGGTGFKFWLPERDAIVMALVLFEAIAARGGRLSFLRTELYDLFGRLCFKSKNVPLLKTLTYDELDNALNDDALCLKTSNRSVNKIEKNDGRKICFDDCSWLLMRLSGTEPIVRLYAESEHESDVVELLNAAEVFVKRLISHRERCDG